MKTNYLLSDDILFLQKDLNNIEQNLIELMGEMEFTSENETEKFITIILWIIISNNKKKIPASLKNRFLSKYQKYLSSSFDKKLKISSKMDRYIIEDIILDYPLKLEIETLDLINHFSNLENISTFEGDFKKFIFSEEIRTILFVSIENELIDKTRIQEIFKILDNYLKSESVNKREIYQNAKRILNEYKELAENGETYYCKILLPFINQIYQSLKKHFHDSIESKPAIIEINKTEKKYPLFNRDSKINIELEINNIGEGPAYDLKLFIKNFSNTISISKLEYFFGIIEKGTVKIEIKILNELKSSSINLEGECNWIDIDDSQRISNFKLLFECQREDIDWVALNRNKPYNLEPVTTQEKLIGRIDVINALNRNIQSNNIESYLFFGQKRTGKTSIVKTFETIIKNIQDDNSKVIYIDGGDLAYPEVKDIISNFGKKLCEIIKAQNRIIQSIPIPLFDGALAPIDDFLLQISEILPNLKIIIIIDEFDEFTFDLYKGKYADSFFQTIRSISSKPNFGFILVGGEKMEIIKKHQGFRLNKFKIESISYFDKENNYPNFINLVRKPISGVLDISDEGIDLLYEYTSGNPYFTKLICINLFEIMLKKRDSSITKNEVEEAIQITLDTISSNSFQHFWTDGVLQEESRKEDISDDRRKLLLALAESLREKQPIKERIIEICEKEYFLKNIISEDILRDFIRRDVLNKENSEIHCKVKLFEKWLIDKGVHEIAASSISTDSILREKLLNEQDIVHSKEIYELLQTWGSYRGNKITEDNIRVWLNQFGSNINQRLAFKILKGVKFYNYSNIREKLGASFDFVKRTLNKFDKVRTIEKGEKTRKDILVSYLDEPAKSGAYYAKQFADENGIFYQNVVDKSKIINKISSAENMFNGILFIDDFVGTGQSITE